MARTGITYIDVENAAQQLQGRGKNPTVDSIREMLGTGSKSTIAQHLRTWKAEQLPDQAMLPQELLSLVSGLWEKLNAGADERVERVERETREELAQLAHQANYLQQELSVLSHQKLSLDEQLLLKEREQDQLAIQLTDERQKNQSLVIQQEAQCAQLAEMKNENQRLHQLATHIQANLEHYQAAMQKLQIEQNLVLEKQQAFFQQQLSELDTEVRVQRQKAFELEHALQASVAKEDRLQEALLLQQETYETLSKTAQETAMALTKSEMYLEQHRLTLSAAQQELADAKHQLQALQTEHAISDDQLRRTEILLRQKEDTLEVLRQEKLFLIQENAELKGYLKKMDVKKATSIHAE